MTIISHRHRFVFVAVPKTGTHSIRFALRDELGPGDEEQVGRFVKKRLPRPEFAHVRHGHLRAADLRSALGASLWSSYFTFAVVRNPWDRFVSFCAFMSRHNGRFEADPRTTMRRTLFNPKNRDRVLFRPQHELVTGAGGEILVDRLCRAERLQQDFDEVCAAIGLRRKQLGHVNASRRGDYRQYYDPTLAEQVGEFYRRDVELFGYEF